VKKLFAALLFSFAFSGYLYADPNPITIIYINGDVYAKLPYSPNMWARGEGRTPLGIYELSKTGMFTKKYDASDLSNRFEYVSIGKHAQLYKRLGSNGIYTFYMKQTDSRLYYGKNDGMLTNLLEAGWQNVDRELTKLKLEDISIDPRTIKDHIKTGNTTVIIKDADGVTRIYKHVADNYEMIQSNDPSDVIGQQYGFDIERNEMVTVGTSGTDRVLPAGMLEQQIPSKPGKFYVDENKDLSLYYRQTKKGEFVPAYKHVGNEYILVPKIVISRDAADDVEGYNRVLEYNGKDVSMAGYYVRGNGLQLYLHSNAKMLPVSRLFQFGEQLFVEVAPFTNVWVTHPDLYTGAKAYPGMLKSVRPNDKEMLVELEPFTNKWETFKVNSNNRKPQAYIMTDRAVLNISPDNESGFAIAGKISNIDGAKTIPISKDPVSVYIVNGKIMIEDPKRPMTMADIGAVGIQTAKVQVTDWNDKNIKEQLGKLKAGVVKEDMDLLNSGFLYALISNRSYLYYFKDGVDIIDKLLTQNPSEIETLWLKKLRTKANGYLKYSNDEREGVLEVFSKGEASSLSESFIATVINQHILDLIIKKDRDAGRLAAYSLMVALNKNDKLDMTAEKRDDLKVKLQQTVADAGLDEYEVFNLDLTPEVYEEFGSSNLKAFEAAVEKMDNRSIEKFLNSFFQGFWKISLTSMADEAKKDTNDLKAKAEMLNRMLALSVVLTYYVTEKEIFMKKIHPGGGINEQAWRIFRFGGEVINAARKFEYGDGAKIEFKFDKAKGEADKVGEDIRARYKAF